MSETIRFRRLVLELGHGDADAATMRQAAALARLMDAELHALFVEDDTLLHASQLPFTREISLVSGQWRPLAADRLEAELRAAADRARRYFLEAARGTGVRQSFEISRGDVGLLVAGLCVASDIVVVPTPGRTGSVATYGFQLLRETARRSVASVLFLPPDAGRGPGPVVAVATGGNDPSLGVARLIAVQYRGGLVIVAPAESGIGESRPLQGNSVEDIDAALGDTRERLIVMMRANGPKEDLGAALAAARGVPVLVVEPD